MTGSRPDSLPLMQVSLGSGDGAEGVSHGCESGPAILCGGRALLRDRGMIGVIVWLGVLVPGCLGHLATFVLTLDPQPR